MKMASHQVELNGIILLHKTMRRTDADDPNIPIVGISGIVHR